MVWLSPGRLSPARVRQAFQPACWRGVLMGAAPHAPAEWTLRIACGAWRGVPGVAFVRPHFPEIFLPLYRNIEEKYHDFHTNPNLARLYRDNGAAVRHVPATVSGFLFFEAVRRELAKTSPSFPRSAS